MQHCTQTQITFTYCKCILSKTVQCSRTIGKDLDSNPRRNYYSFSTKPLSQSFWLICLKTGRAQVYLCILKKITNFSTFQFFYFFNELFKNLTWLLVISYSYRSIKGIKCFTLHKKLKTILHLLLYVFVFRLSLAKFWASVYFIFTCLNKMFLNNNFNKYCTRCKIKKHSRYLITSVSS